VQTYTPKSNHTGPLNMATCFEQVLFSAPTKKVNLQTNKCYFQHRQRRSTCKRTSAIFSTDKEGQPANEQPYFPLNMATRFEQVLFSAPTKK
jgi:hypothetical protein